MNAPANKLRTARLNAGSSQKKLARELGFSQSQVSDWERGVGARRDTKMILAAIARLAAIPADGAR
jgi:transcriptional regulator with XRE-family HTH domain